QSDEQTMRIKQLENKLMPTHTDKENKRLTSSDKNLSPCPNPGYGNAETAYEILLWMAPAGRMLTVWPPN
ncbi:unnamed protein product, partial [Candidula unifasciata]